MKTLQKEFHTLLLKHIRGRISYAELRKLIRLIHQTQKDKSLSLPSYEDLTKDESVFEVSVPSQQQEEALQKVLRKISARATDNPNNDGFKKQKNKSYLFQILRIAAVFIFLIVCVYFVRQVYFNDHIPKMASQKEVILQLDEGNTKVIEEGSTFKLYDKLGNVIGETNENKITYYTENSKQPSTWHTLSVPYGKKMNVELSDGTKIIVNAGTNLRYPTHFPNELERRVYIDGEAYFEVAKKSEKHSNFIVSAGEMNVKVYGTAFNITSYPEDKTKDVVVVEGLVSVFTTTNQNNSTQHVQVIPDEKATLELESGNISKEKVDVYPYMAWVGGELVFRYMSFENILKKLERHFNLEIINNDKKLAKEKFNANFGNASLEDILRKLSEVYDIKYTFENNRVNIYPKEN